MESPWSYDTESAGDCLVVRFKDVSGVSNANSTALNEEILHQLDHEVATVLILELSALDFVPSPFLGMLLMLRRDVPRRNADLRLVGISSVVAEVLEVTKLHRLFRQYKTVEKAMEQPESPA